MADTTAQKIIAVALGTRATHPHVPALDVLDLAMQGHEGCDLCFEAAPGQPFDDWLDPPSPFADLLRQAFLPDVTLQQARLWTSDDDLLADGFREMWQDEVIEPFAQRYRLWQG